MSMHSKLNIHLIYYSDKDVTQSYLKCPPAELKGMCGGFDYPGRSGASSFFGFETDLHLNLIQHIPSAYGKLFESFAMARHTATRD